MWLYVKVESQSKEQKLTQLYCCLDPITRIHQIGAEGSKYTLIILDRKNCTGLENWWEWSHLKYHIIYFWVLKVRLT